jgi:hypothetical protein
MTTSATAAAITLSLFVAGCGSTGGNAAAPVENRPLTAAPAEPSPAEREIAQQVARATPQLPARLSDTETLTGARAERTELALQVRLSSNLRPGTSVQEFTGVLQEEDQNRACSGASMRRIIILGGTIRSEYSTPGGTNITTRVTACPAA